MSVHKLICHYCKKEFDRSRKAKYPRSFCSKSCQYEQSKIDQSNEFTQFLYTYNHAKRRAKKDNIYFDLLIEDIVKKWEDQNGKCVLSGEQLFFGHTAYDKRHGGSTASLDRKDAHIGYEVNNIQWVHKDIQKMKMDMNEQIFKYRCRQISDWTIAEGGLTNPVAVEYNTDTLDVPF